MSQYLLPSVSLLFPFCSLSFLSLCLFCELATCSVQAQHQPKDINSGSTTSADLLQSDMTVMAFWERASNFWRPCLGLLNENKDISTDQGTSRDVNQYPELCPALPSSWGRPEFASPGTVFTPTQRNGTVGKPALLIPSWMALKLVSNRCLLEHALWSLIELGCVWLEASLEFLTAHCWWSCFLSAIA